MNAPLTAYGVPIDPTAISMAPTEPIDIADLIARQKTGRGSD
ncbi:hypothetical protein GCM10022381_20040 [Leifsonia kafniensis]|uniref:Uncharacterized protein n=1 Tax=Leifsonia kafniensis TaxID=475957 RepID=A0ABP7KHP4_9MICO